MSGMNKQARRAIMATTLLSALVAGNGVASPPTPAAAEQTLRRGTFPQQWYAPLPHNGKLSDLAEFWQRFDDPLLAELIIAGQEVSPTIASARARIEQSRATRVAAGAALMPSLDAVAGGTRSREDLNMPVINATSGELQASWEIDVFGSNRAARNAAQARFESAQASWHDARVSVAAEVANTYLQLRFCEALVIEFQVDAQSRAETARLTALAQQGGFQSPANAALARAGAAQGNSNLTQQRSVCDRNVKSLVALVGIDETPLRDKLAQRTAKLPRPLEISVTSVPAQALAQRPDLVSAARELEAASADVRQSEALRYPRIFLGGSIGAARVETSSQTDDGTVWSVGPVSVSLPIFDGGRRRANVEASRALYDAAVSTYEARLRQAVSEVEQSLISLQAAADRTRDAQQAADDFQVSFVAAQDRYNGGLGSLFELEDARREAVQARIDLAELETDRVSSWISLYRALGGSWESPAPRVAAN
jgi:NodT family efflux transporter outer membrane factor (OMF) lipoprotein